MALVVDSGVLVGLLDDSDHDHAQCRALVEAVDEPLVLPAATLPEVEYMVSRFGGSAAVFASLLDDIEDGVYRVVDLRPADLRRVREVLRQYEDLRVGFVDAAVLAIVERLGETKLATLDHRHFAAMRPRHIETLELLPA